MPRRGRIVIEPAYTTTCDGCGQEVGVDRTGFIRKHNLPDRSPSEQCPNSQLRDLNPPSGDVFGVVSGGLPDLGKSRKH